MTTLDNLVQEVRSRALSGFRDVIIPGGLGTAMDNLTTTVTVPVGTTNPALEAGATLQIDYELTEVEAVVSPTEITVRRGQFNSVAAAHAVGAPMIIAPHFPIIDIVTAINEDIADLSAPGSGMYQTGTVAFTFNPAITGYDLVGLTNAQVLEVIEVRTWDYGSQRAWPLIPPSKYKLERNAQNDIFPSTMSLKLYEGAYPGRPVRVQYKSPYTPPLVNPTDDVLAVTGLQTVAHDIPVLGAVYRLMAFRDIKRSFSEAQGEPRRAAEVPVGSSQTALKTIAQMRTDRINTERSRLNQMYRRQRR